MISIRKEIELIQQSYMKVKEIEKKFNFQIKYKDLQKKKDNGLNSLEQGSLFRDYIKLYNNILNSIDTHSTIWRNYQFNENQNLPAILNILSRQSDA